MDLSRIISLKCGVCGNTNFEYDDSLYSTIEEAEELKCSVCSKVYTPDELQEANSVLIDNAVNELADEVIEDSLKKLKFKL